MDPRDSRLCDMVITFSTLTLEDAVAIIYGVLQKPTFQTAAASRKLIDGLALPGKQRVELLKSWGSALL